MAVEPGLEASARESCPKNECYDAVGLKSDSLQGHSLAGNSRTRYMMMANVTNR